MLEQPNGQSEATGIEPEGNPELPKRSYHLRVVRHAERLPDGSLRPEGVAKARAFGATLSDSAVVKGYASTEASGRTVKTSDLITEGSGVVSPSMVASMEDETSSVEGPEFATRQVDDIEYNMIEPQLLKRASGLINKLTLEEVERTGLWPTEGLDIKKLPDEMPEEVRVKIGEIRQEKQDEGFKLLMDDAESVHNMAMGIAHQFVTKMGACRKLHNWKGEQVREGNVDLNIVTHGTFTESTLLSAGVALTSDGPRRIADFDEIGGYFKPNESWYLDISDPNNIPELIPVVFEKEGRPEKGKVFVSLTQLKNLDDDYKKFKEFQGQENTDEVAS